LADIIDNREEQLADHVSRILSQSQSSKIAVGYLFLSGLKQIEEHLDRLSGFRLLIGNQSNQKTIEALIEAHPSVEAVARHIRPYQSKDEKKRIADKTRGHIRNALSVPPLTDEDEKLIAKVRELIKSGCMEVRVYTKEKLHAKAYIFGYPESTYEDGIGIVGSSNLTLSGLTSNSELNVIVHGNDNFEQLNKWFDRLWKDAVPFEQTLMDEIRESWAGSINTPYEIYLSTLYHLVRDRLTLSDEHALIWDSHMPPLTPFQEVAVSQGIRILDRFGGVFISDVVGLGKTFIGVGMLRHLQRLGLKNQIVICPNALEENWRIVTREYGLIVDILPLSRLSGDDSPEEDPIMSRCDVVLIDESHNFRNHDSRRYQNVEEFLRGRKVILLTATPRNNSARDIYHQIRLFQDDQTDLDIGAEFDTLHRYFNSVKRLEETARDTSALEEDRTRAKEQARERIERILQQVLIRRTRRHIQKHYADSLINGKPIKFPKRNLSRIDYSIDASYGNLYEEIRTRISTLSYARYSIGLYVRDALKSNKRYSGLAQAGRSLRGIIRVLLLKRFESSVEAFRNTVTNMIRVHELFEQSLNAGRVVSVAKLLDDILDEGGDIDPSRMDEIDPDKCFSLDDFESDRLLTDIQNDRAMLKEIQGMVKPIGPEQDAKLQKLISMLCQTPLQENKALIFTQYADTARYLHENLKEKLQALSVVDGSTKNKHNVLRRFAPQSNRYELKEGEQEIQTVIATDVLSEGLNLQDCSCVVNYDLHWNPVRLIQRVGRIDRIGSSHELIHIFNFFPETALDAGLGLRERLTHRIQEIHDTIGEDEKILDETERLNEEAMYATYGNEDSVLDDEDDAFDVSEAEEMIRNIRDNDPEAFRRLQEMPLGIRSSIASERDGMFVFCEAGNIQRLYLADKDGEIQATDPRQIIPLIRCEEHEPTQPLRKGHNAIAEKVRLGFITELARIQQNQKNPRLEPAQTWLIDELRSLLSLFDNPFKTEMIHRLIEQFSQPLPSYVLALLKKIKRQKYKGEAALEQAESIAAHYELEARLRTLYHELESEPIPRIICSESIVKKG